MIHIRKATTEDLKTILNFNKKLAQKEHGDFDTTVNSEFADTERGQKYFKNSIEGEDSIALIAEVEGAPAGYLVGGIEKVSVYRNIGSMCEVDFMWVDEEYRGKSIGKQLMEEATQWAKEKGVKRMRVIASYSNKKAIEFYKREGFFEYDLILEKNI